MFDRLSCHAAAGRLDVAELERRVAIVAAAQTREETARAFADLPPLPAEPIAGPPRRHRGHGDADAPGPEWQPTRERFRDPRTNRIMRVWEDPAGGRHYVADDER